MRTDIHRRFCGVALDLNEMPLDNFRSLLCEAVRILEPVVHVDLDIAGLASTLSLSPEKCAELVDLFSDLFKQAAHDNLNSDTLIDMLVSSGLDQAHAQAVCGIWKDLGNDIARFPSLQSSDWHLAVLMARGDQSKLQQLRAVLTFKESSSSLQMENDDNNKVSVEFDHEELLAFFRQIEEIRAQLDHVT